MNKLPSNFKKIFSLKFLNKLTTVTNSEIIDRISSDLFDLFLKLNFWFHTNFTFLSYLNIFFKSKEAKYRFAAVLDLVLLGVILTMAIKPAQQIIEPIFEPYKPLKSLSENQAKNSYEVFGFAPYWTFSKLDNVDFKVLTTMAYFGLDVDSEGNIEKSGPGYQTFKSQEATNVFRKAHQHGTRVVLTLTQMDNKEIRGLMDNPEGQKKMIDDAVSMVKERGIDGVNVDFEYMGNPGDDYRKKFTVFIDNLTQKMHQEIPGSKVSISVYASAVKNPKIYDLAELGKLDIKVFMMAYDFGYRGSDEVIPTSPLYGHKSGKYWYDIATAVEDFTKQMPASKLILGSAWYGYNYPIAGSPREKAPTVRSRYAKAKAETYALATDTVKQGMVGATDYKEGWDDEGKVAWKAYFTPRVGWRMMFLDDVKSLSIKYDYAKEKSLGGVGMWALGFDNGKKEFWTMLKDKFGMKDVADSSVTQRQINE